MEINDNKACRANVCTPSISVESVMQHAGLHGSTDLQTRKSNRAFKITFTTRQSNVGLINVCKRLPVTVHWIKTCNIQDTSNSENVNNIKAMAQRRSCSSRRWHHGQCVRQWHHLVNTIIALWRTCLCSCWVLTHTRLTLSSSLRVDSHHSYCVTWRNI